MKSIIGTSIAATSLFAALALAQPRAQAPSYTVTDLGPVGIGQPYFLTNNSIASGAASNPDGTDHAVLWYKGLKTDLGTPGLGGPNSVAFGANERGQAVGEAETSTPDPNGEDFCGFNSLGISPFHNTCLPFLWENGVMTALPTLGGNNGVVNQVNDQGQAAGGAENTTRDPSCPAPYVFQVRPATWHKGNIHELATVAGDLNGLALAISDNGQVVGASGDCGPFNEINFFNLLPRHALLWQNGTVTDLGNLGGTGHGNGNLALDVNNLGHVVGDSDIKGDANFHAFLWTSETGMQDLGTLPGDANSSAISINDAGEVVGVSFDASFNFRAFLRQSGVMMDLNTLIPADSPLQLMVATSINARGQITGIALETSSGEAHAFLATPR
jgi:probable HAF family extracellular repeat protein